MTTPKIKPKATLFLTQKNNTWRTMADVIEAFKGKPVKISGTVVDLQGCQISGSKLPKPKNKQDEDAIPLRTRIPGFTLKNGSVRAIPGGIVAREKGCTFFNLTFLETGEDCLSNVVDDSEDFTIKDCRAFGASDKSFQCNDARGLVFEGNTVSGGITGIRIQKTDTKFDNIKTKSIKGNKFVNVDTAFNCSGGVTAVIVDTVYDNVRLKVKTSNGAKVTQKIK